MLCALPKSEMNHSAKERASSEAILILMKERIHDSFKIWDCCLRTMHKTYVFLMGQMCEVYILTSLFYKMDRVFSIHKLSLGV